MRIHRLISMCTLAVAALDFAVQAHAAVPAYVAAWNSTTAYTGGNVAGVGSSNYTANWWTHGNNPATNSGVSGSGQPWAPAT